MSEQNRFDRKDGETPEGEVSSDKETAEPVTSKGPEPSNESVEPVERPDTAADEELPSADQQSASTEESEQADSARSETESSSGSIESSPTMIGQGLQQGDGTKRSSGAGKWPWVAISLVAIAVLTYILIGSDRTNLATVAKVNGEAITKDQLYNEMVKYMGDQTVNSMVDTLITEALVNQEAKKAKITVTDQDLNAEIDEIKKQFSSDEEFEFILMQNQMTIDQLKDQMRMQVQIEKLFEPQIEIKEEDIKRYFEENIEQFGEPEQIRASHILVDTQEEADSILKELQNGADFAQMAKEKSQDGSKDQGGDLDFFAQGRMVPEFDEAAFKLQVGEMSNVVESQYGYHIIKVTDKKEAAAPTFEEHKEDARKQLFSQELNAKAPEDRKSVV